MQRVKLAVWAQKWDIESNSHRKDRQFCLYEPAVMNYLRLIHRIFSDFGSLDTPAPVLNETRALVSMDILPQFNYFGSSPGQYNERSWDPSTAFSMRSIKWAAQEDKLKEGLACLSELINDLRNTFPPPHDDPAETLLMSASLAAHDPNELARISRVEDDEPRLATLAWMKSVAYRPYGAHFGNNQLRTSNLIAINRKEGAAKYMARYQDELVLVEEKHCTAPWGELKQLNILKARIDNIVARLQNPDKPVDMRTLSCRGGAFSKGKSADENETTWIYSIVYRADYPRFTTFREVLSRKKKEPDTIKRKKARFPLGKRFTVAQMLARALMYLHLVDWLHKAVRSENVPARYCRRTDGKYR
ncbi:hypothetical protein NW755_012306 [Fusarium falciforme]|uniref:Protein kinase domain-containing protein n=1 Tax=Fusarium falciforme TaxID=195108 RepID=A0A9W8UU47_9HYPO|nr:hypothetical protein NW755_012306 [Fusarium falciforme]